MGKNTQGSPKKIIQLGLKREEEIVSRKQSTPVALTLVQTVSQSDQGSKRFLTSVAQDYQVLYCATFMQKNPS